MYCMKISEIFSLTDNFAPSRIEKQAIFSDYKNFSELENKFIASMIVSGSLDNLDYLNDKQVDIGCYAEEFGLKEKEAYQEMFKAVCLLFERVVSYEYYHPRFDCNKNQQNPSKLIMNKYFKVKVCTRWISDYIFEDNSLYLSISVTPFVALFIRNMVKQYKMIRNERNVFSNHEVDEIRLYLS